MIKFYYFYNAFSNYLNKTSILNVKKVFQDRMNMQNFIKLFEL